MKKIIFTVTNDLTYDQRMDRICSVLSKEGYEVTIIGRRNRSSVELKVKPYHQKRLFCFFNKGKLFYAEYNFRLFFVLLFSKADIISSIDLDTILPAFIVSRIRSRKFVYDAHEYFTELIEIVNRPLTKKIWTAIEAFVLPKIQYAYTVSEGLKNLYEQKYKVRFEVIRNVPLLQTLPEPQKTEKVIVYIGAVNEGRGLEEMIEAMPAIDGIFHVYGNGDIYPQLVERVVREGLSDKIKFFGYVEPGKLKELTIQAYVGILLLKRSSLSYYYSLANKFFDYIHAGIPQVVIDFPEYIAINEKYKVAEVASLEKKAIVNSINKLLKDESHYRQLKENCYKAREVYNWQNESKKLIEFYKNVVSH